MKDTITARIALGFFCVIPNSLWAHQPVMDMAPRWKDGFGFQIRQESQLFDNLMNGDTDLANPLGLEKKIDKTWLEGIYTFRRGVRLSFKLPWIHKSYTLLRDGAPAQMTDAGVGDLIIGVPLKKYKNQSTMTGNIAFTPSIRLPTGSTDSDLPFGDGSIDIGVSFSKSKETAKIYQYYDLYYWKNNSGTRGIDEGDELALDINVGYHPIHNNLENRGIFLMMDVSARHREEGEDLSGTTGGTNVHFGPVFVYYVNNIMVRAEYKIPAFDRVKGIQLSKGNELNIGIGIVFSSFK